MSRFMVIALLVSTAFAATPCVDKVNPRTGVSDCPARAKQCNDATYYTLMTDQCPKTCNRCPSNSTCVDKVNPANGISDCPNRKEYCTVPVYLALMQDQCPKTCGFCS